TASKRPRLEHFVDIALPVVPIVGEQEVGRRAALLQEFDPRQKGNAFVVAVLIEAVAAFQTSLSEKCDLARDVEHVRLAERCRKPKARNGIAQGFALRHCTIPYQGVGRNTSV